MSIGKDLRHFEEHVPKGREAYLGILIAGGDPDKAAGEKAVADTLSDLLRRLGWNRKHIIHSIPVLKGLCPYEVNYLHATFHLLKA